MRRAPEFRRAARSVFQFLLYLALAIAVLGALAATIAGAVQSSSTVLEALKLPPGQGWLAIGGLAALVGLVASAALIPLKYSWRNLLARWRTTVATAAAFALVTALLVVMLAFVNGMVQLADNTGRTDNVVVLSESAPDEIVSSLQSTDVGEMILVDGVQRDGAGRPLASLECYMTVSQPLPPTPDGLVRRALLSVRGVDDAEATGTVRGIGLREGTWLRQDGWFARDAAGKDVDRCFISAGFAAQYAKQRNEPPLRLGDALDLAGRPLVVHGILDSGGTALDNEVWVRRDPVCVAIGKRTYTTVALRAAGAEAAEALAKKLTGDYSKARLLARVEREYYSAQQGTARQLLGGIMVIAVFMAIGGVFGVMNTMFAAAAQRKRDIGVLRIIGYQRSGVLVAFFLESMLLALLGGLAGCAIGLLADGAGATSIIGGGGGPGGRAVVLRVTVSGMVLAIGLGSALLMGVVGGLFPAISAMRLRPLESLR